MTCDEYRACYETDPFEQTIGVISACRTHARTCAACTAWVAENCRARFGPDATIASVSNQTPWPPGGEDRLAQALADPEGERREWFWLSFAADDGWLGTACVLAESAWSAPRIAAERGCNPGGQVLISQLPIGYVPPEALQHKLVSDLAELERLPGPLEGFET